LNFDYKDTLTGTGNGSFVDSSDVITLVSVFYCYTFDGYRGLSLHPFLQLCFALL